MDQVGEIILRLKINELEAQLALREIERAGLNREIADPATSPERVWESTLQRERSLVKWSEGIIELHNLRNEREREWTFMPRGALN